MALVGFIFWLKKLYLFRAISPTNGVMRSMRIIIRDIRILRRISDNKEWVGEGFDVLFLELRISIQHDNENVNEFFVGIGIKFGAFEKYAL